jgi:hypothetical protein
MSRGLHRRFGLGQVQIKRHELPVSAPFNRAHVFALLQQKILQRTEQKRAQSTLLLIGPAQRVVFKQMDKKTLDDVLRVSRRVAATSNESVKRRPVCFTKSSECFPRSFIRLGLACLQYDRPVRRLKRSTPLLQGSRYGFRNQGLPQGRPSMRHKITWQFDDDFRVTRQ